MRLALLSLNVQCSRRTTLFIVRISRKVHPSHAASRKSSFFKPPKYKANGPEKASVGVYCFRRIIIRRAGMMVLPDSITVFVSACAATHLLPDQSRPQFTLALEPASFKEMGAIACQIALDSIEPCLTHSDVFETECITPVWLLGPGIRTEILLLLMRSGHRLA